MDVYLIDSDIDTNNDDKNKSDEIDKNKKEILDMIMKTTIILNNKVNFLLLSCSSGQNLLLTLFKLFKV